MYGECVCMYVSMYVWRYACIQPEDAFMRAYTHLYAGTHRYTHAGTDARRRQKAGSVCDSSIVCHE